MAETYDYDLIVIGAGSGGVRCARTAAKLGARVACIEARFWGGTCVNVGCVPKKLYVMGSEFSALFSRAQGFGWDTQNPRHHWSVLQATVANEVGRLSTIYDSLLHNAGVARFWGQAELIDAHHLSVGEQILSAKNIVIATGSQPMMPQFPGAEHVMNSDAFFALTKLPVRSVVIGGGYIAVELAGILAAAGSQTTLVYRGDKILRGFDADIRAHLQQCLQQRGIRVITHAEVERVDFAEDIKWVVLKDGQCLPADQVLAATGRTPNTHGLGLDKLDIQREQQGGITVDKHFETSVAGIFAVGDVLHRKQLTPVALAEGMYVAHHLFGEAPQPIRYDTLASAVFSQPPIGTVGLSEEQCRERGHSFKIFRSDFKPMSYAFSAAPEKIMMKILVDVATDKVLGMHMVGDNAGEIIQGFAAAMTCGVTKQQLDSTLGIHPTVAEELVTMRDVSELVRFD